jgi:dolichyl-phosphate-mannose-protein mannosyltransferase
MISLKNNGCGGGLLHVEPPAQPPQALSPATIEKLITVTAYPSRVFLNDWVVFKAVATPDQQLQELEPITDGDIIVLSNRLANCQLNARSAKSPYSSTNLATGCTFSKSGGHDVMWRVEIVHNEGWANSFDPKHVRTILTSFRLYNLAHQCYLRSPSLFVPHLPYRQMVVACDPKSRTDNNNIWNVEQHWNEKCKPLVLCFRVNLCSATGVSDITAV